MAAILTAGESMSALERIRVAIVDDDTVIRMGLPTLLPDVDVVRAVRTVEELRNLPPTDVDVVLLDLNLNGVGEGVSPLVGRRAVEQIANAQFRCLIYTNEHRRLVLAGCIASGALGVVHKSERIEVLQAALQRVASNHMVLSPAVAGLAETVLRTGPIRALSPRQVEVLRGRARGESFRSIAQRLYISERTAEDHLAAAVVKASQYLDARSPGDVERELGLRPGDLMA